VIPILLGTLAAVRYHPAEFHALKFFAALSAMLLLHAGTNLISDGFDFLRGLDRVPHPASGAVVRGWLTPEAVVRGGLLCMTAGVLIGLGLVWSVGPVLLVIGGIGFCCALFYTSLKYLGLGELAVFVNFALLGAAGAWTVQTGRFSWLPLIWAVPNGLLITAILHANNWRDREIDQKKKVHTLAGGLGDRGSFIYYGLLLFSPFVLVPIFCLLPVCGHTLPWSALTVLAALFPAGRLWRKARLRAVPQASLDFKTLDAATAQLNIIFGLLYLAGIALQSF
jgi:1,4-dihydroxy-2-naphthoate octaprenyltransferase